MFFTCPPTLLTRHVSMLAKLGFKSMSFLDRTKIEARFPETDQVERLIFYSRLRGCSYITQPGAPKIAFFKITIKVPSTYVKTTPTCFCSM